MSKTKKLKFFEFSQNNSGGRFSVDDNLAHRVLIEADTPEEAAQKAEDLGMYWDGVYRDMDCPCCGDRWYKPWSDDSGMEFPYEYTAFKKEEAEKAAKEIQGAKVKKLKPGHKYGKGRDYVLVFPTPEVYAQYQADHYGWTKPDAYIHYKAGRKVEIYSKKEGLR